MLETINRKNYERFLIDFADGKLSAEQHALVLLFLEQNPDIAEEFEGILNIELEPNNYDSVNIDTLKQSIHKQPIINNKNYEHYFIAYHEGDINAEEKLCVEEFVTMNPQLRKEFMLFQKVAFDTSNDTTQIDKSDLKRIVLSNGKTLLYKDFYNYCIAYHEGDLDTHNIEIIENTIHNSPLAATIFNSFANLKIQYNNEIIFPDKASLKKKGALVIGSFVRYVASVAAALAFVLLYYFVGQIEFDNTSDIKNSLDIATIKEKTHISSNISNSNDNNNNTVKENYPKDNTSSRLHSTTKSNNHLRQKSIATVKNIQEITNVGQSSLDMKLLTINIQEQFVVDIDTGYYLVIASNDNNLIERNLPTSIKSTIRKIRRLLINEKEELKAETPRNTIINVTQFAIAGFNKMTESNYTLNGLDVSDKLVKEKEEMK